MDPTTSATAAAQPSDQTAPASAQTATDAQKQAFDYALSAALNRANVLGGAGGNSIDDDDDDGSALTVGIAV